ncbi:MAG: glycosyltransferase family 4 protein [Candidatus Omnitrophica bacterium]|nr:glycosyltransferase family 4 protein [Candidatus Omnitrophota bacterium]
MSLTGYELYLALTSLNNTRLVHIITKLELGGAQKNALDIVAYFQREGYQVFLLTGPDGILSGEARKIAGITCIEVPHLVREIHPLKDIVAFFYIFCLLKKFKPHIVHTHSSKAGILGRLAARMAGIRSIYHTIHGYGFHPHQPFLLRKVLIACERIAAVVTTKLITVSLSDREVGLSEHIGKEAQYVTIPYGIKKNDYFGSLEKGGLRKRLHLPQEACLVGTIACFKPQKGLFDFVRAARRVCDNTTDVAFIVVGDGALRNALQTAINACGLERFFYLLGWRRDVKEILHALDIFVLSSLWEGLPIVFLEAMCASLPIVATDVGGSREVIQDGHNGFLVDSTDWWGLADKVTFLVQHPKERRVMGKNSLRVMQMREEFEKDHMLLHIKALYGAALGC